MCIVIFLEVSTFYVSCFSLTKLLDNIDVRLEMANDNDNDNATDLPSSFPARFMEVCLDGDVEDLVQLFEEMARIGEPITPVMLNIPDASGRVRRHFETLLFRWSIL